MVGLGGRIVEFDPLIGVLIVGVFGIILWIVTNWHLLRTGKAIKADIDDKREATEEFVRLELSNLKTELGKDFGDGSVVQTRIDALGVEFREEIKGLESYLEKVKIDATPLLEQVQETLIPAVEKKVKDVQSVILGKLGYAVQGVKALGEGTARLVGEAALEKAGFATEMEFRLAQIGIDEEWMRKNKAAAAGLMIIKGIFDGGTDPRIVRGVPTGAKQVGPGPKAPFGGI